MGRLCSGSIVASIVLGAVIALTPQGVWAQEGEEEAAPDGEGLQQIYIAPRVGLGRLSETTVDQTQNAWLAGLLFRWYPNATSRLSVDFRVEGYDRDFLLGGLGAGGGTLRVSSNEIRLGGTIDYGYNWLDPFGLELWTSFGWRHDYYDNDYVDENFTGAFVQLLFGAPLTRWLSAYVGVDYCYNLLAFTDLLNKEGKSITGGPLGSLRWLAGFAFNINDVIDVGLAYQGEHVPYDNSDLLYHYVMAVVGVPIRF